MRKILLTIFVTMTALSSYGQGITPGSTPTGTVYDRGGHVIDSFFVLPYRDTLFPTWVGSQRKNGAIIIKSSNNTPYYYANGAWRTFSSGSGYGVDTSAWHKSGDSVASGRFIGTTNDVPFIIKRNNLEFLNINIFDGVRLGRDATLAATGLSIGRDSYNTGFNGAGIGGGYNEGSQALSMMVGAINTGDRSIVIGRGAYSNKQDVISIGTTSRSTHIGNFIANDGMYNPANFNSRKDYEFITHYTNGYHFETAMPGTAKYADIDSFGTVDAYMHIAHSNVPTITLGTGAGTTGSAFTTTGDLNNYSVSVTIGTAPVASTPIFTASGFPTYSVIMLPVWSEGNLLTSSLSGTQRPFLTGTTNTHVLTSGSVALVVGNTYVFNVICIPKF